MKTRPTTSAVAIAGALFGAQIPAADLPAPAWLAGDWCGNHGTQRLEERWTPPADNALFAVSRTFDGGKLSVFEFLRIERTDGAWELVAQPGGAAPTRFKEVERSDQRIAFFNPKHDFPQRIEYWRDAAGLHAAIEGPGKDGISRIAHDFKAGACTEPAGKLTMGQVLEQTTAADWRTPDPARLLYLDLEPGRVIIELAPDFAPKHVANLQTLVHERYFDGLAILRSQDNFVVQWGDPNAGDEKSRKSVGTAQRTLPAEFERSIDPSLAFTALPDRDGYAPEVGFSGPFPSGRDPGAGKTWLAHCYGTLGVGRDTDADSGGGTELYVVTGHAPRQLDRNITVVGRVLKGMELLSTLPRGTAPLGFYEKPEQRTPIQSIRLAADVPEAERVTLQVMRTNTASFQRLIEARRNRGDEWYKRPAGYIDLCSVPVPVR